MRIAHQYRQKGGVQLWYANPPKLAFTRGASCCAALSTTLSILPPPIHGWPSAGCAPTVPSVAPAKSTCKLCTR